jgi:hypothetical protein
MKSMQLGKTACLLVAYCASFLKVGAQVAPDVYQSLYDRSIEMAVNAYLPSSRPTSKVYFGSNFGDGLSYALESLLIMYEKTGDRTYLDTFVHASQQVMRYRDDHFDSTSHRPVWSTTDRFKNVSVSKVQKFLKKHPESIVYSDNDEKSKKMTCPGPVSYQNALILMPMAHFVYLCEKGSASDLRKSWEGEFVTFDQTKIHSFLDYSRWLTKLLFEVNGDEKLTTYEYFEKFYWIPKRGYRQYADDEYNSTSKDVDGMDRNCNWGVVNCYLAAAFEGTGKNIPYLEKANVALLQLRRCLKEHTNEKGIVYYQWSFDGWKKKNKYRDYPADDLSHAGAVVDLACVGNRFKTIFFATKELGESYFFSEETIQKIRNTLLFTIYVEPLKFHNAVNGSCLFYKWPNCEKGDFIMNYSLSRWLQLSTVSRSEGETDAVYQVINDFFSQFVEHPELIFARTITNKEGGYDLYGSSLGTVLLGIASASRYSKNNELVGRLTGDEFLNSKVVDFNGDEHASEFIVIQKSKSKLFCLEVVSNDKVVSDKSRKMDMRDVGFTFHKIDSCVIDLGVELVETDFSRFKNRLFYGRFTPFSRFNQLIVFDYVLQKMSMWDHHRSNSSAVVKIDLGQESIGGLVITKLIQLKDEKGVCYFYLESASGERYFLKLLQNGAVVTLEKVECTVDRLRLNKLVCIGAVDIDHKGVDQLVFYDPESGSLKFIGIESEGAKAEDYQGFEVPKGCQNAAIFRGDFNGDGLDEILFIDRSRSLLYSYSMMGSEWKLQQKYSIPFDEKDLSFELISNPKISKSDLLLGNAKRLGLLLVKSH